MRNERKPCLGCMGRRQDGKRGKNPTGAMLDRGLYVGMVGLALEAKQAGVLAQSA